MRETWNQWLKKGFKMDRALLLHIWNVNEYWIGDIENLCVHSDNVGVAVGLAQKAKKYIHAMQCNAGNQN